MTSQGTTWVVVRMTTRVMATQALVDLPAPTTITVVSRRSLPGFAAGSAEDMPQLLQTGGLEGIGARLAADAEAEAHGSAPHRRQRRSVSLTGNTAGGLGDTSTADAYAQEVLGQLVGVNPNMWTGAALAQGGSGTNVGVSPADTTTTPAPTTPAPTTTTTPAPTTTTTTPAPTASPAGSSGSGTTLVTGSTTDDDKSSTPVIVVAVVVGVLLILLIVFIVFMSKRDKKSGAVAISGGKAGARTRAGPATVSPAPAPTGPGRVGTATSNGNGVHTLHHGTLPAPALPHTRTPAFPDSPGGGGGGVRPSVASLSHVHAGSGSTPSLPAVRGGTFGSGIVLPDLLPGHAAPGNGVPNGIHAGEEDDFIKPAPRM